MLILTIVCILCLTAGLLIDVFLFHSIVKFTIDNKKCYVFVPRSFKKNLGIISDRLRG